MRGLLAILTLGCVMASGGEAWAQGKDLAPRDWRLFVDWRDGRLDPRLERLDDAGKLKKIAKALGVKPKELKAVVARVEPLEASLVAETEAAIRKAMETTPLKPQLSSVEVNADTGHVVAYIKWKCGDQRDVDKEAAWAAWATGETAPVVNIVGVWCVNSIDTKLFSAKIGRAQFGRINKAAIERFASSRYIKLFEQVKRGPHR